MPPVSFGMGLMAVVACLQCLPHRLSAAQDLVCPRCLSVSQGPLPFVRTMASFAEPNENFRAGVHFGQLEPAWASGPQLPKMLARRGTPGPCTGPVFGLQT